MKSFTPEKLLVVLLLTALPFSGHSVTPSGTENLFVSNLLTGTIWQFGLGGELISSSYGVALDGPQGLAFDHSGNLYVAYGGNTGRVAKFGPGGNLIDASFASGFTIPGGMAFDSTGNLYVANGGGRVSKFDSSGNLLSASFATGLSIPWSIAFDTSDNLYVANAGNNACCRAQRGICAANPRLFRAASGQAGHDRLGAS